MEKQWWPQPSDAPAELAEPALTFLEFCDALESLGLEFIDSTHAERFGAAQGSKRRTLVQWMHTLRYEAGELEPAAGYGRLPDADAADLAELDAAELEPAAGDDEPTDSNGDEPAELEPEGDGAAAGADKRATARSKKKGRR
jgi:hypothetical protein